MACTTSAEQAGGVLGGVGDGSKGVVLCDAVC